MREVEVKEAREKGRKNGIEEEEEEELPAFTYYCDTHSFTLLLHPSIFFM
jgi:hypothetical protein